MSSGIRVEVVYALPERQQVVSVELPAGATAREAAVQSGLAQQFAELDVATVPLGVFGERVEDDYRPDDGDRIELYRPLLIDPMQARRRRAASSD